MPTIPIVPETVSAVPLAITPSTVTEAKLIAAYAEWDGTGASGAFLPCLAIYSDAGVRLGRVFPSSTVAKGDSAVVTYAPFPGGIGPTLPYGAAYTWQPAFANLAAGAHAFPTFGDPANGGAVSSGTQVFAFTGGDYASPIAIKTGMYAINLSYWRGAADVAEPGQYCELNLYMAQNGDNAEFFDNMPLDLPDPSFASGSNIGVYRVTAGDVCSALIRNKGANTHDILCQLQVAFWATL